MSLRNVAIIAHVDHGKTTLVDQLFRQSGTCVAQRVSASSAARSSPAANSAAAFSHNASAPAPAAYARANRAAASAARPARRYRTPAASAASAPWFRA